MQAITFLADIHTNPKYKNMLPPGVEGWTDPSNNEAWLAGTLGFTQNAYTLYAQSKATKNPVYPNTAVLPGVLGPGTDQIISVPGYFYFCLFKDGEEPGPGEGDGEVSRRRPVHSSISRSRPVGLNHAGVQEDLGLPTPSTRAAIHPSPLCAKLIEAPLPIKSKTGYTFPQTVSPGNSAVLSQYILLRHDGRYHPEGYEGAGRGEDRARPDGRQSSSNSA